MGQTIHLPLFRVSVYINIFTICTIRNQHDILKTAVADVSKRQTVFFPARVLTYDNGDNTK